VARRSDERPSSRDADARPPRRAPPRRLSRHAFAQRREAWRDMGLARRFSRRAIKRARIESLVLLPLVAAVLLVYSYREQLFGRTWDTPVRSITALALIALGWQFARDIGRALAPELFARMDPGTAGTIGFLIRLLTLSLAVLAALRIAGLGPQTLAFGGAVTAVVIGLAAQQTFGNLFAGTVLLSARPFRVGERVRLQGGGLAGSVEGVVSSLGLLYTTLTSGDNAILVPNSVVLSVAVVPIRAPEGVDVRARLRPGFTPVDVEEILRGAIRTAIRGTPRVMLEELDGDEMVVRVGATPVLPSEGPQLAGEVIQAIAPITAHAATETVASRNGAGG
jgi:small conductance mechanosensitive channel